MSHTNVFPITSQDMERGFTNTAESLESVNARGTTLVDGCKDELTRESGRSKLAELNELWGECLAALSEREEMLKKALQLAEKYQVAASSIQTVPVFPLKGEGGGGAMPSSFLEHPLLSKSAHQKTYPQ